MQRSFLMMILMVAFLSDSFGQCISIFPYNENFENSNGNWTAGGTNSDWAWGTPVKTTINSASSGAKCWISGNLSGNSYNGGEKSFVESPCFDFTSLINPIIKFSIFWDTERQYDGGSFQFSINNGQTWSNVGNSNDPSDCYNKNWFNSSNITNLSGLASPTHGWSGNLQNSSGGCLGGNGSGQWVEASHCIGFLAGKPSVKFRFIFGSGTTCNNYDGIAFDDFFIGEILEPIYDFQFNCTGNNIVDFAATSTDCPASYAWNFDDVNSSNNIGSGASVSHIFSAPGSYNVSLTITYPCIGTRVINKQVIIPELIVTTSDVTCLDDSNGTAMVTVSLVNNPMIKWLPSGSTGSSIDSLFPGQYFVTILGATGLCETTKPFTIGVGPDADPKVNIGGLIKICPGDAVKLNAGNFNKYSWNTGDTTSFIVVSDSGFYSVLVENASGCTASDSAQIVVGCGNNLWFPSAFTPDEDGVNDLFLGYGNDVNEYQLIIFNRMGQVVFETKDVSKGWDGMVEGVPSQIGVYGYTVRYKFDNADSIRKRGIFTLIR
ncbi:MAG: gliding motility-associated C-terminal domain-containing protein [Bacteroidota bacterium]|jgi:gliding motility-associated-like protein